MLSSSNKRLTCSYLTFLMSYNMKMSACRSKIVAKTWAAKICRKHLENHHGTRSARLLRLYAIRAKFRLNRKSCPEGFGVSELFLGA